MVVPVLAGAALGAGLGAAVPVEDAELLARALHGAPTVVVIFAARGHVDVDARAVHGTTRGEPAKGLILDIDGVLHSEDLGHVVVVEEQDHLSSL